MALKKNRLDFPAIGAIYFASILPDFELNPDDEAFVTAELKWLFSAADNLVKIIDHDAPLDHPITAPIPPEAHTLPAANNRLLNPPNDLRYDPDAGIEVMLRGNSPTGRSGGWQRNLESIYNQIKKYLNNLKHYQNQVTKLGGAAQNHPVLQSNIRGVRINLTKNLAQLADLMNKVYGVQVSSPEQLVEWLESTR